MRYNPPGYKTGKPGPGAYMSEKVIFLLIRANENHYCSMFKVNTKRTNPEYSFGVKHSKFIFVAKPDPSIPTRPLPY